MIRRRAHRRRATAATSALVTQGLPGRILEAADKHAPPRSPARGLGGRARQPRAGGQHRLARGTEPLVSATPTGGVGAGWSSPRGPDSALRGRRPSRRAPGSPVPAEHRTRPRAKSSAGVLTVGMFRARRRWGAPHPGEHPPPDLRRRTSVVFYPVTCHRWETKSLGYGARPARARNCRGQASTPLGPQNAPPSPHTHSRA